MRPDVDRRPSTSIKRKNCRKRTRDVRKGVELTNIAFHETFEVQKRTEISGKGKASRRNLLITRPEESKMARANRDDVNDENRATKAISGTIERRKSFGASINRLRTWERLAKVGNFEEKRRFPEKGPRYAIESGRVLRKTRKSDPVVENVVRALFEFDRLRESSKAGLRGRFWRDSKIKNATKRRIRALGTSNKSKSRPNRSKIDELRKGPRRERSAVRPGDPFEKFARDALGAERRKAKEEFADNDSMTSREQDGAYAFSGRDIQFDYVAPASHRIAAKLDFCRVCGDSYRSTNCRRPLFSSFTEHA